MSKAGEEELEDVLKGLPREHVIEDVQALKAMADPLRVSILKALYEPEEGGGRVPPRSAKMLCVALGESRTTKIYHHLKLLLEAGLIQKVKSERIGNLIEDSFGPVALNIRLSPTLLTGAQVGDDDHWLETIYSLLEDTRRDLTALAPTTPVRDLRFKHLEFRLPRERVEAFYRDLAQLLDRYERHEEESGERIRVLFVAYPSPPGHPKGSS